MKRRLRWVLLVLAALIAVLPLWAVATADGRALIKAAVILPEVLPDAPLRPLNAITEQPVREEVAYVTDAGTETGTLYRPFRPGKYGAVILHLGVNPDPDDITLHRLAAALARSDVVALIPRSSRLMAGNIDPAEVDALIGAFQYLRAREEVDGERVGFAGFCVGASLSALAAADPRIADQVAFVNFFGGWSDAREMLVALVTERQQYGPINEPWQPQELAQEVFVNHLVAGIPSETERALLAEMARNDGTIPTTDVDVSSLSPAGRSIAEFLQARDATEAEARLNELPVPVRERLRLLSPGLVAGNIQAEVFIMHDRNDTYVPFVESRRFADALGDDRATVTEFSIFQHMHPRGGRDTLTFALEVGKLAKHLHGVLAQVS